MTSDPRPRRADATTLVVGVLDAQPSPHTAAPGITLRLRIEELSGAHIHAIALRCQTRIEPRGRRYSEEEQARLYELFGAVSQWNRTLQGVTWAHSSLVVPSFARRIDVDLAIPCTYDLEVAASKYFHGIRDGDVPLVLLFSGTVFRAVERGKAGGVDLGQAASAGEHVNVAAADSRAAAAFFAPDAPFASPADPAPRAHGAPSDPASPALFVIEPIPWDLEASYRMPAHVWHAAMSQFFSGGGWIRLHRDTIDRLQAYRGRQAVVTWDEAIDRLLQQAPAEETV